MKKLLLLLLLLSQFTFSQSWIARPNLSSTSRTAVGSFAIGSKGYFIGGETSASGNLVDNWEYDTSTNTWSQKANYPGTGTQKGVAFSINGIGYYGLGTAGGILYSYNSSSNTWTQKATCSLASVSFWSTTYFVIGTKAYFLDQNNKFFSYDSGTDTWTNLTAFTGTATTRATGAGFSINGKGYICSGINSSAAGNTFLSDLWEYNPTTSTWTQKASLPTGGRYASFGFSFNNKGYIIGGEKISAAMTNEFLEYNPVTDTWTALTNYIGGAKNYLSGFVANNSVYIGFGSPGFGVSLNEYGYFNQSSSFCTSLSGSLQNGLVGFWPFCGNANDGSGNGNNGTVNGATLTADRFGNSNSSYNLVSQNSNYLEISNSPLLNPISSITLSSWVKLNSYIDNQVFVSKGNTNQSLPYASYTLKMGDNTSINSKAQFQLSINGIRQVLMTNSTIPLSNWIYITGTYDGNVMKIFVNGVLDNSFTIGGSISSFNTNLNFGRWAPGIPNNPQYLNGFIDDIGIWNRALTQQEITSLYNQNQCINTITVTDTLIINVGQLSYTAPITYANNITIYPNPANTLVNISFVNISDLSGGTIKIINSLGQQVATTPITLSGTSTIMQLNTWGGTGMYFVQIINAQGQIVDIKKIILQ